jgi:hypothetical protein
MEREQRRKEIGGGREMEEREIEREGEKERREELREREREEKREMVRPPRIGTASYG